MSTSLLPRLRLLSHSQLQEDSYHSLLISLLRGLAALQVAAAHIRAEFMPGLRTLEQAPLWYQGLAFLTGFAHQAVLVFFLISGWLVGGSLLNKRHQPDALKHYAIDRITRLWTVLLPTLGLILALAMLDGSVDPRRADLARDNPFSLAALAGNLAGLQTIVVPAFGGNFPLWSLANETWYYLLFALLVMSASGRHRLAAVAGLLAALLWLPFDLVLYFSIWLLGAAGSRLQLQCGIACRIGLLLVLGVLSVWYRLTGSNDAFTSASFGQDLLLSILLLLILCSSIVTSGPAVRLAGLWRLADGLASFSFTLYVVHVPLLGMLGWLGMTLLGNNKLGVASPIALAVYCAIVASVLIFSYGFYRLFEARTGQIRRWVKSLLLAHQPGLRAM